MKEIERIEDQFRRCVEGEAWHGPALKELLADVTSEEATAKAVVNVHSIWEIVLHIISTQRLVCDRLQGKPTVLPAEEDWPVISDESNAAWNATIEELRSMNQRLRNAVRRLDDSRLEEPIVEGFSSIYVTLHETVQHNLYHGGQIALLKKTYRQTALNKINGR